MLRYLKCRNNKTCRVEYYWLKTKRSVLVIILFFCLGPFITYFSIINSCDNFPFYVFFFFFAEVSVLCWSKGKSVKNLFRNVLLVNAPWQEGLIRDSQVQKDNSLKEEVYLNYIHLPPETKKSVGSFQKTRPCVDLLLTQIKTAVIVYRKRKSEFIFNQSVNLPRTKTHNSDRETKINPISIDEF